MTNTSGDEARRRARQALEDVLGGIAPEIELEAIDPRAEFRREVDLDSVDVLNVLVGLEEALEIDIPEADASRITTLEEFLAYLADRMREAES